MSGEPLVLVLARRAGSGRLSFPNSGGPADGPAVSIWCRRPRPTRASWLASATPRAVRQALEGTSAVVHLAATPDDDDFLTKVLPNNIVGENL